MAANDNYNKKSHLYDPDDESGEGGKSGAIEFHDFLSTGDGQRDDLSPQDERHLLAIHNDTHEKIRVDKQKKARERYQDLKNGKVSLDAHRKERMKGEFSQHPILSNEAQFSGADKQVDPSAVNEELEANQDKKEEKLTYQKSLQLQYANKPNSTPTLRRN
jgi:hypothetical protein